MSIAIVRSRLGRLCVLVTVTLLFGACAVDRPRDMTPIPGPGIEPSVPPPVERAEPPPADPMVEVPGDKPLPLAKGAYERFDCMTGVEDEHARIAFEALGGQVTGFSLYSKWKPRTCSIDVQRTDSRLKWRRTPEGAIRVHTPDGVYVIRSRTDAYVFEFQNVQRMKPCGMMGAMSGTMTVKRQQHKPVCSVAGIMER